MPALLPLNFDAVEAPVTAQPYAMSPLTSGFQLSGIAAKLKASLPPQLRSSDHSIPHIGAYVEYMRAEVLHNSRNAYVSAWHGLLCMVGLSRLYGYELSIKTINMTAPPATVNGHASPGPVYKRELERLHLLDSSNYYVLYRTVTENNQPVEYPLAALDPYILLVPFKNIDPRAVADVPWCNAATGAWWWEINYDYDTAEDQVRARRLTEYCQLAAWLDVQATAAGNVSAGALQRHLLQWRDELLYGHAMPQLSNPHTIPGTQSTFFASMNRAAFSAAAFCQVPDLAVPIVPQFAPRLVLAHVEQLSTTTDWNCAVADANGQTLAVLPPLTAEFARLLEENAGHGQLKLQSIQVEDQFMANNRIRVELVFTDGPLTLARSAWYTSEQIVFADNFPYFSMWPYVNLPADQWNQYYVHMVQHQDVAIQPTNCKSIDARQSLHFAPVPDSSISEIVPLDNPNVHIQLRFSSQFPSFVPLQYTDELGQVWPCGCLLVKPAGAPVQANPGLIAKACIDFGTSNSVCVVKAAQKEHCVLNGERVKALVTFSGGQDAYIEDFHRYHGISTRSRQFKFPSVAQLYSGLNDNPIKDGQVMLTEGGIIDYFAGINTNLPQVGIFSDLKSDRNPLADVNRAGQVFIKHLALLCALEAKCLQANGIEYYFSYPNEQYLRNLAPLWTAAIAYINSLNIFAGTVTNGRLTERMASAHYVRTQMPDNAKAATPVPGFAVVDIGGGTSDMTVWRQPTGEEDPIFRDDAQLYNRFVQEVRRLHTLPAVQGANLSFRYAGNQLFGRTFFTYFKRNPSTMPIIFPRIFGLEVESGRAVAPRGDFASAVAVQRTVDAVNNYMASLPNVQSLRDQGFPALTALLNTLLEEPGIKVAYWSTPVCAELRKILSFKLKGILYVLGLLIGECAGIHPDNQSGIFNIYLVGGGSQAYRYVDSATFDEGAFSMLAQLPGMLFEGYDDVAALRSRFHLIPPPDGNKVEVVDGMLSYEIDNDGRPGNILTPTLPDNPLSDPGTTLTSEMMNELRNAYCHFIQVAVEQDSALESLLPTLELVEKAEDRDDTQNKVYQHYMATYQNIWSEVNRSLDANVSTVVREAVFAVMMAEEMLN